MAKHSMLDNNSELYAKRKEQTEKEKLSEMSLRGKIDYIKDYYLKTAIGCCIIAGIFIWILVAILSPKANNVLSIAAINDYINSEKSDSLIKGFGNYLGINKEKDTIIFDSSYSIGSGKDTELSFAAQEKLSIYLSNGGIDIIIAEADDFAKYTKFGYFADLTEYLPTDLYSNFSNSFYTGTTDEDKEEKAYGIYLNNCKKYKELGSVLKNPVFGIVVNSKHIDNATEFLRYLYEK